MQINRYSFEISLIDDFDFVKQIFENTANYKEIWAENIRDFGAAIQFVSTKIDRNEFKRLLFYIMVF